MESFHFGALPLCTLCSYKPWVPSKYRMCTRYIEYRINGVPSLQGGWKNFRKSILVLEIAKTGRH